MSKCILKRCPFCNGDVDIFENYREQFGVICSKCETVVWIGDITNKEDVKKKWNERKNI